MTKKTLIAAATVGLFLGACASKKTDDTAAKSAAPQEDTGECHGINSCKGKGACGGKGHSCSGQNSCKGKGWLKTTKAECLKKKGKFKEG